MMASISLFYFPIKQKWKHFADFKMLVLYFRYGRHLDVFLKDCRLTKFFFSFFQSESPRNLVSNYQRIAIKTILCNTYPAFSYNVIQADCLNVMLKYISNVYILLLQGTTYVIRSIFSSSIIEDVYFFKSPHSLLKNYIE